MLEPNYANKKRIGDDKELSATPAATVSMVVATVNPPVAVGSTDTLIL
jgi:hypothetical protein